MKRRIHSLNPAVGMAFLLPLLLSAGDSVAEDWAGPFTLIPVSAPDKGLDDFGGGDKPGARQDLWKVNPDGTLTHKERFFWLHVPDGEDDAGAECVCYAHENRMLVATRCGIQICADDGPTQVILPMPDRSRVIGVCFGGPELNTLYAFCGDKIWKRVVKLHGIGAFSPWAKVSGNRL